MRKQLKFKLIILKNNFSPASLNKKKCLKWWQQCADTIDVLSQSITIFNFFREERSHIRREFCLIIAGYKIIKVKQCSFCQGSCVRLVKSFPWTYICFVCLIVCLLVCLFYLWNFFPHLWFWNERTGINRFKFYF